MQLRIHRNVLFKSKINKLSNLSGEVLPVYYFVSSTNKLIDKNEIEASRILISKELRKLKLYSKKKKNFWLLVKFNLPYTKKSAQSRMGKGKGGIDSYKCYLNVNSIIFKMRGISDTLANRFCNLIRRKLSFDLFIYKKDNSIVTKI